MFSSRVCQHGIASIHDFSGTGKTVTGAYLVYFFTEQNKLLPNRSDDKRPQILYCGPSNKAVDVITGQYGGTRKAEYKFSQKAWISTL